MRSNELASLAGVTVRALRHYHELGILQEPARSANGYRRYTVHHLIRVLRIKRLAGLGFALTALAPILDGPTDDATALLDELDSELANEMETLRARREVIAELKRWNASPDLPSELTPYAAVFAATAATSTLARFDREQAILLSHLAGPEGAGALSAVYARFTEPEVAAASAALTERLSALEPDAPEAEIASLASDIATAFAPLVADVREQSATDALDRAESLMSEYTADVLNVAQRRVVDLVEQQLSASIAEHNKPG